MLILQLSLSFRQAAPPGTAAPEAEATEEVEKVEEVSEEGEKRGTVWRFCGFAR